MLTLFVRVTNHSECPNPCMSSTTYSLLLPMYAFEREGEREREKKKEENKQVTQR